MTVLSLHLLGPFEAKVAGQTLSRFRTDKVRALLAFLALESDQPHRRDRLAALLWPEWDNASALRNLRKSLHRLRESMDAQAPLLSARLLSVERQAIQLHADAIWVDAVRFETQITAVQGHPHTTLAGCDACLNRLDEAGALYRGELLAGLSLADAPEWEEWLLIRRETLHHQALDTLDALAAAYLQRRDWPTAHGYALRQLALDPWRESAYRQGMLALAEQGQRAEALALYERCRDVLADEMGVEPAPETTALYQRLRHGGRAVTLETPISPSAPRLHHFPVPLTPFVGRAAPLAQAVAALRDPGCRLVTLHGPGGIGKTRLALQVAARVANESDRFRDGLFFIPLAPAGSRDELLATVVQHLGLEPAISGSTARQVADHLRSRDCLLVLDNFEQLLDDGVELLLEWLNGAPGLALLITSREPLRTQSEWAILLRGLDYPAEGDTQVGQAEAVKLFVQALRRVRPDFVPSASETETIAHICRLVEGMPLALELAARWARAYELETIADEIARDLDFLVTPAQDVPERHRSIRVIFEQSWQRLSPPEQAILAPLSLFRGSFTAEAARAVTGASLLQLASLLDHSLISRSAPHRYEMHELLRQFAEEKLAAQDEAITHGVRAQHAAYFLRLLADQTDALQGENPRAALTLLQQDLDNLRQAWGWTAHHGTADDFAHSISGLARFHRLTGQLQEGVRQLSAAAARVRDQLSKEDTPRARNTLAHLLIRCAELDYQFGEMDRVEPLVQQSLALADRSEPLVNGLIHFLRANLWIRNNDLDQARDEYNAALAHLAERYPARTVDVLYGLGSVEIGQGRMEEAIAVLKRGLAIAEHARYLAGVALAQRMLGSILRQQGEAEAGLRAYQRALVASRQAGDRVTYARVLNSMGTAYMDLGRLDEALDHYRSLQDISEEMGLREGMVIGTGNIGEVYARAERWDEALGAFEEACEIAEQLGRLDIFANYQCSIAGIYRQMGRFALARQGYERALDAAETFGHHRSQLNAHSGLGDVLKDTGKPLEAIAHYDHALRLQRQSNHRRHLCQTLIACAEAWLHTDDPGRATPLLAEARQLATEFGWSELAAWAERVTATAA